MQAVMSVADVMMILFGMVHRSLVIWEDMISSKKFALAVAKEARAGDHLVVVGDYESASSLNFYEPLCVAVFDGVAYALIPGTKYRDAPRIVLTRGEFKTLWRAGGRVFALLPEARQGELLPEGTEMLQVLVRNH